MILHLMEISWQQKNFSTNQHFLLFPNYFQSFLKDQYKRLRHTFYFVCKCFESEITWTFPSGLDLNPFNCFDPNTVESVRGISRDVI